MVAIYLRNHPDSRLFDGRSLILGGSHSLNYNLPGSLVGDLSAILIENINPLANLVRVPKKQTALLSDFEVKRDRTLRVPAQECDQHLGRAVVDAQCVGARDGTLRQAASGGGVAQSGSVLPRRHLFHSLSQAV